MHDFTIDPAAVNLHRDFPSVFINKHNMFLCTLYFLILIIRLDDSADATTESSGLVSAT